MRFLDIHTNQELVNYNKVGSSRIVEQHQIPYYNKPKENGTDE
jgi:hypothetical protein